MKNTSAGNTIFFIICASSLIGVLSSCSSAPKRTMERTTVLSSAYSRLDLANTELAKGDMIPAQNDIDAAYIAALSIDNADLLTKVCLTKMTVATSVGKKRSESTNTKSFKIDGKTNETAAGVKLLTSADAQSILDEAKKFALRSSNPETNLAICSLYEARLLMSSATAANEVDNMKKALALCNDVEPKITKLKQYLAYLYRTRGEILFEQKEYDSAQKEFLAAAELHTKERYLSEIGLDWYFAAKSFSAADKKQAALDALQSALKYDRLDESPAGIASDYYGLAVVLLKGNPTPEEKKQAVEYAQYSAAIYRTGGFENEAKQSLSLVQNIK